MNYATELRKFATSQYIFSAVRITLAIVVPSIILAYFGCWKRIFSFSARQYKFCRTYRSAPTFIRRRNALVFAIICFFSLYHCQFTEGFSARHLSRNHSFRDVFFHDRLTGSGQVAVGSLSLVVLAIFIDGHLSQGSS